MKSQHREGHTCCIKAIVYSLYYLVIYVRMCINSLLNSRIRHSHI